VPVPPELDPPPGGVTPLPGVEPVPSPSDPLMLPVHATATAAHASMPNVKYLGVIPVLLFDTEGDLPFLRSLPTTETEKSNFGLSEHRRVQAGEAVADRPPGALAATSRTRRANRHQGSLFFLLTPRRCESCSDALIFRSRGSSRRQGTYIPRVSTSSPIVVYVKYYSAVVMCTSAQVFDGARIRIAGRAAVTNRARPGLVLKRPSVVPTAQKSNNEIRRCAPLAAGFGGRACAALDVSGPRRLAATGEPLDASGVPSGITLYVYVPAKVVKNPPVLTVVILRRNRSGRLGASARWPHREGG
jgi:hypothetical protein